VQGIKQGNLVILDNLEQAHHSTIEVLSTLIHHRFLQLPDGTRLVSSPAFEILKNKAQCTGEELNKR
jgi:midasin (ATPase involved in ribosome maturation)